MGSCKQSQEEEDICLQTTSGGASYGRPYSILDIVDIFELQYGETKVTSHPLYSFSVTLEEIIDNVPANCGQVSDRWRKDVVFKFEHGDSLLWYSTTDTVYIEKIDFPPCGAWEYRNDGTDLKEIQDSVSAWRNKYGYSSLYCKFNRLVKWDGRYITQLYKKSAPNGVYRNLFIYIAKVYPLYGRAKQEDYRFIFIITVEYP
jgi:hypothetical protein